MRKLLLSSIFLAAGLGWPSLAAAQLSDHAGIRDQGSGGGPPRALSLPAFTQAPQQATPPQQAPPPQPQVPLATSLQQPGPNPTSLCGYKIDPPENLPPAGSGPVVYLLVVCFPKQENRPVVEGMTYNYYIQLSRSEPKNNKWTPYDENAEKTIGDDFKRLWSTNFLDDLSIETVDYRFSNGVLGKLVVYNMEERQRVKIYDFEGNAHVEQSKIEDKLKEDNVRLTIDTFIDQGVINKVKNAVVALESEKGYEFATVTPKIAPIEGQTKTVHLTFVVDEGPKVKIKDVTFVGTKAMSNRALKRQMKNNKEKWFLSFITARGTYQKEKYEEDADRIVAYYRDHGYVAVRVGEPELKYLEDSLDRQTRWIELRIPITEGDRYKINSLKFDGNKVVKTEFLQTLFKSKPGDWYNEKQMRKGIEKVQEVYGTIGYWEFVGFPDLSPVGEGSGQPGGTNGAPGGDGAAATDGQAAAAGTAQQTAKPTAIATGSAKSGKKSGKQQAPAIDVTMRLTEGKQYFVHRITFEGNTTTRDNVVRREMRLYEGGVFNTEALKFSVKRINQLGYFKSLEGDKDMQVEKTAGADNQVDVTLKVQEQNRNQITFGAGVSQFEGFFGQLGFQTANFMGRGETFNVSLQAGSLAQLFQVGFTEPFLFDRNLTGGINLFKNRYEFINQFTQASTGGNLTFGFPVGRGFSRMFINYSYEHSKVEGINQNLITPAVLATNPYLSEMLLLSMNGNRTISKVTPSFVYNSVDDPIFASSGKRLTASVDLAGIGGDTNFYKPYVEGVWYIPVGGSASHKARTSFGFRAQMVFLSPFTGSAVQLPIFERLVMGGEYSVRGFDLRSIGPKAIGSPLVIGGNKSLLFNAEYIITIAGPVRLVLFADAGQIRDVGQAFGWKEPIYQTTYSGTPILYDPTATIGLTNPGAPAPVAHQTVLGYRDAFKTSTGAEIRFFMPVLNVPFRLIFAWNPSRAGILDNSLQAQKAFSFRFAVGTTF